ncbi:hypothetical protein, partial [Staphylococcus aureus]|uniref:hypothetical protein n=1 Tax=Staphylococcus aureus TaxID=1280 RepID=UPI001C92E37E
NHTQVHQHTTSNIEHNTNKNPSEIHLHAPKTQHHPLTQSQLNNIHKTLHNQIQLPPPHKKHHQTNLTLNSFKTNILNHPHLLQHSTINQIQNHNPQITQNVQNQTPQTQQNLQHKTIQNLN